MKKIGFGVFCVALCLTVAFIFPQMGTSEEMVNSESCLLCHNFAAEEGDHTLLGHNSVCGSCHEGGITTVGNVASSKCIVCHPIGDTGEYALVNQHDPGMGGSCLSCHTIDSDPCPSTQLLDENDLRLNTIRQFRDEVLTKSKMGKKLINYYYRNSADMAVMLEKHPILKGSAKKVLEAMVPVMEGLVGAELRKK